MNANAPQLVNGISDIIVAIIERYHLLVIRNNGSSYGCGLNEVCQPKN
jgi:hypothetical protein